MKLYQSIRNSQIREMFEFDSTYSRSYSNQSKSKKDITWQSSSYQKDFNDSYDENISLDDAFENIFCDAFESLEETEESLINASKMFKPINETNSHKGNKSHQAAMKKHEEKMELHRKKLEIKRKEIEANALMAKQKIAEERLRIQEVMKKQRSELDKRKMDSLNAKKAEEAKIKFIVDSINNEFDEIQKKLKNISF